MSSKLRVVTVLSQDAFVQPTNVWFEQLCDGTGLSDDDWRIVFHILDGYTFRDVGNSLMLVYKILAWSFNPQESEKVMHVEFQRIEERLLKSHDAEELQRIEEFQRMEERLLVEAVRIGRPVLVVNGVSAVDEGPRGLTGTSAKKSEPSKGELDNVEGIQAPHSRRGSDSPQTTSGDSGPILIRAVRSKTSHATSGATSRDTKPVGRKSRLRTTHTIIKSSARRRWDKLPASSPYSSADDESPPEGTPSQRSATKTGHEHDVPEPAPPRKKRPVALWSAPS